MTSSHKLYLVIILSILLILPNVSYGVQRKRRHTKKKSKAEIIREQTRNAHVPSDQSVELHHSLRPPHDTSQVYWNYGGATVLTKNFIRLTPAAQDRKGWIWNDYPLESEDFEIRFKLQIFSKPHYGGDGMCMWLLDTSMDPAFDSSTSKLDGDIFGMKETYKGMGLCVDVYDNDSKRNNPSVFVLYNPEGKAVKYNHDNDYEDDEYKNAYNALSPQHRCVVSVRNQEVPTKFMVKFLHKILHVYVDVNDGSGFKSCLALKFNEIFKDHHIAFTAMTGQVGDAHQLTEVTTRYLDSASTLSDDLESAASWGTTSSSSSSSTAFIYWTLIMLGGVALICVCIYEIYSFKSQQAAEIHAVHICKSINQTLLPHYMGHLLFTLLLLLSSSWFAMCFNILLVCLRGYLFSKKQHQLTPMDITDRSSAKLHGAPPLSFMMRQIIALSIYCMCQPIYLYRWFYT